MRHCQLGAISRDPVEYLGADRTRLGGAVCPIQSYASSSGLPNRHVYAYEVTVGLAFLHNKDDAGAKYSEHPHQTIIMHSYSAFQAQRNFIYEQEGRDRLLDPAAYLKMQFNPVSTYTEELSMHLEKPMGYPLWYPTPMQEGEVEIGDVGYVSEGRFKALFNVITGMKRDGKEETTKIEDLNCLDYDPGSEDYRPGYMQPRLYEGKSVRAFEGQGEIGASTGHSSARITYTFTCSERQGAVLHLDHEADLRFVPISKRIKTYVRQHRRSWIQIVERDFGSCCNADRLIFVLGWVKTSQWAVAAFRVKEGSTASFEANVNLIANAGLRFKVDKAQNMKIYQHDGPRSKIHPDAMQTVLKPSLAKDQCIFLRTMRTKRRIALPSILKAAAGSASLPDAPSPEDATAVQARPSSPQSSEEGESELEDSPPVLPLDALLDYILNFSDAEFAMASDEELELLLGHDSPSDVAEYLATNRPAIEVDEEKMGTLSHEYLASKLHNLLPYSIHAATPPPLLPTHPAGPTTPTSTIMSDVTEDIHVSDVLQEVWSQWSTLSERCGTVKFRRRHFQALIECYRDIIERAADYIQKETVGKPQSIGEDIAMCLEQACKPIKTLLDFIDEKGLLWSVMHAQTLNNDFETLENDLESISIWFHMGHHHSRLLHVLRRSFVENTSQQQSYSGTER
ncbi:hypothetical protein NM688_g6331 [Phlebia brevispora]|uniref:Uncharacterized protein n=1 Tax=Phlebia brevispora TaxID=194682 RepID=A0ACC1SH72_9APHY|nr:hypothetical protein NM688_g6331 [Phlebia brevispora]